MDRSVRLLPRSYSIRDASGNRRLPNLREVAVQFIGSVNFIQDRRQGLRALFETYHVATFVITILFFVHYLSVIRIFFYLASVVLLANLVNTVWYHRYGSHRAFRFSRPIYAKMFLWFNPVGFREEIYALLHHIHHDLSDDDDDPYGPHLGAFGSYVASGEYEIDSDVSADEYKRIKRRLAHVAMPFATHESFCKWRSVEWIPHYLARWSFANVFWAIVWYYVGGTPLLMAWYSAIFTFTFLMRDFNYRGHADPEEPKWTADWDLDHSSNALNQLFYGYIASEWHNNHHSFRASANCGFLPGQFDLSFLTIRLMHRLGIVTQYNDHFPQFKKSFLAESHVGLCRSAESSRGS